MQLGMSSCLTQEVTELLEQKTRAERPSMAQSPSGMKKGYPIFLVQTQFAVLRLSIFD